MTSRPLLAAALVVSLGGFLAGSDCQQCQPPPPPRRGNVDITTDAVLVTHGSGDDAHTFALLASPEIGHLRVLDLTDEAFVESPNRFFPLSIPVGPSTRAIATAPLDDAHTYALDTAVDTVFVIDERFQVVAEAATDRAPADVAAWRDDGAGVVELWVALPDRHELQVIELTLSSGESVDAARIALPAGAVPEHLAIDPTGDAVVVTDAGTSSVHVVRRADRVLDRSLDVGGPTGALAVGVVDLGDGEGPVAVVLRGDGSGSSLGAAYALRLFRPGFREDRYVVLGGTELPEYPLSVYVPDQRGEDPTVCCRGLSSTAIDGFEGTAAWAAIGFADGKLRYLTLAGRTDDPTRDLVRLIDDDADPIAPGVDLDTEESIWVPIEGGEARRPVAVTLAAVDNYGDPPFVTLIDVDQVPLLTWEGSLPGLRSLATTYATDATGAKLAVDGTVDPAARGARVGDNAHIVVADAPAGCDDREIRGAVLSLAPGLIVAARGADGITPDDEACIGGGGAVTVTLESVGSFVATAFDGSLIGRVALIGQDGTPPAQDAALTLPGATLTLQESAAGPPLRGSKLAIPLDPNVVVMGLGLSDPSSITGVSGFGSSALAPTAILGRSMRIPAVETGKTQTARRMIVCSAATDGSGVSHMFACDDAETTPNLCDDFN